ncbi:PREDICTED: B3 domain-containing protein At5g25470-like [Brassica oleracea var. oleracea]|uniref:B3 domain-containing protein At5g25470-like n=1 Tax=Brassica oleracea var. oleracea TaxID=109376 RepID=UPI0006A71520|nr:PREDICTED: B3 domain-containing protein At5g25470-like [Brassica oleracea var. oleracea]
MLPERRMQECLSKSSFSKSLSPGQHWKSKSMRIIPEEFLRSTHESFEHRVVFSVPWNNSWQLWLRPDKKGLFMIKEDWDEFADDNFLGPDDTLVFTHQDTMYFQVHIFKKDGKEIISAPLEVEPQKETTSASASAIGRTATRGRKSCANLQNPERYLLNPQNPYFAKTLKKTNHLLHVGLPVIRQYGLEFGPHDSSMYFILPDGNKVDGLTKYYNGLPSFLGWADVCQQYNLKIGDTVVCEFELSGRVVAAVRVHFVNE